MANEEHLAILKQGVKVWNRWREEHPYTHADLSKADLHGVDLSGAHLVDANLVRADLRGVHLSRAVLFRANLFGADLSSAILNGAILDEATLLGANLVGADLSHGGLSMANLGSADLNRAKLRVADLFMTNLAEAQLRGADLSGSIFRETFVTAADFSDAVAYLTIFASVDLSRAQGLERIRHAGPSTIGIDTVYRSEGRIPELFLRGAGVPDQFITIARSLVARPIEFYSCFISYSTKDQEFAERLHADLQDKGVRCWFAPEDVQGGRKLHEQIEQAIRVYDKLLVVLSEHSMGSEWVKTEIYHARQDEVRRNCRKLFPISLVPFEAIREWRAFDADTGKDMGREVREYFVPDFSNWKDHDAYKRAFDRLLRDLKGSAAAPPSDAANEPQIT